MTQANPEQDTQTKPFWKPFLIGSLIPILPRINHLRHESEKTRYGGRLGLLLEIGVPLASIIMSSVAVPEDTSAVNGFLIVFNLLARAYLGTINYAITMMDE